MRWLSLTQWTWIWANSGRKWRTESLAFSSLWGHKALDTTWQLNKATDGFFILCCWRRPFVPVQALQQMVPGPSLSHYLSLLNHSLLLLVDICEEIYTARNWGLLPTASKNQPPSNNHRTQPSCKWILRPHSSPTMASDPTDTLTAA